MFFNNKLYLNDVQGEEFQLIRVNIDDYKDIANDLYFNNNEDLIDHTISIDTALLNFTKITAMIAKYSYDTIYNDNFDFG